jgi:hypothetical protein
MLAFLQSAAPRDEIDAMLVAQMAVTHVAAMRYAHRLAEATSCHEQDSAERAYNKLTRTFATQMDVYQRRRAASEKAAVPRVPAMSLGSQPRLRLADSRQSETEIIGEPQRVPIRGKK